MGAIAGRGAGGRPLRRRREMVLMSFPPAAARDRSPPEAGDGRRPWAPLLAEAPGGRPLRRRREMVLMSLHRRLRGTAALQKPVAGAGHGRHCWPRRWRAAAPSAPVTG